MSFSIDAGKLYGAKGITNEPIPADVTEICENSFSESRLTLKKLTFSGKSLQIIQKEVFRDCIYLEEVDFSNCEYFTKIENFVFWGCVNLKILKLSPSISDIGYNVFRDCSLNMTIDLTKITCKNDAFIGNPLSFTTEESSSSFRMYENNIYSTNYLTLIYVSYTTKVLKLNPSTSIIGSCAFSTCSLKEVILPQQITQVSQYAFHHTLHLEHIVFSPNAKTVAKDTIETNQNLISIIIPEGVESIEASSIVNVPKLKYIKVPETMTNISNNAFSVPFSLQYVAYKKSQFKSLVEGGIPKHALLMKTCYVKRSAFSTKFVFVVFLTLK